SCDPRLGRLGAVVNRESPGKAQKRQTFVKKPFRSNSNAVYLVWVSLVEPPLAGLDWLLEVKHDGYQRRERVTLWTRNRTADEASQLGAWRAQPAARLLLAALRPAEGPGRARKSASEKHSGRSTSPPTSSRQSAKLLAAMMYPDRFS